MVNDNKIKIEDDVEVYADESINVLTERDILVKIWKELEEIKNKK